MVRLRSLIAAAVSVASVLADEPSRGYHVSIDRDTVRVDTGNNNLYVDLSIDFLNVGASGTGNLLLSVTATPFQIINESTSDVEGQVVYTETFPASGSQEFSHGISFDFETNEWLDFILEATVVPDNQDDAGLSIDPGTIILAPDSNGQWFAIDTDVYVDQINTELINEIDEPVDGTDEGDPEIGEIPTRPNPEIPDKPKEDGGDGTITDPTPPITIPTGPGGSEGGSITKPCISNCGSITRPGDGKGGDDKTTTTPCCGHGDPHKTIITIRKTTTICPTPTPPPPPPCPSNEKRLVERQQLPVNPAYVKGKVQYLDRLKVNRPVRALQVKAHVDVYEGDVFVGKRTSWQTTDLNGEGTWKFSIRQGQRIEVRRLTTRCRSDAGGYSVVTRQDDGTFETRIIGVRLSSNPWLVNAGETKSYTNTYSFSVNNHALWVADTMKVITDYAKKNIYADGDQKLVRAHFPSVAKDKDGKLRGAFFSGNEDNSYINLPAEKAYNPVSIAHEYGHFLQYLGRDYVRSLGGGGPHNFCEDQESEYLSFQEGFATAFGLMALDTSFLEEGYSLYRRRSTPEAAYSYKDWELEDYSCTRQALENEEGRIAAALLDLVDRKLDKFGSMSDDFGFLSDIFDKNQLNIRFDARLIFWTLIRSPPLGESPNTISEFWYNLRKYLLDRKRTAAEAKAWAVLEYNYATFNREP